ncbi:DUF982 domain-containing protein [Neorhizobium galegae]|uniref:DUF982 domain-containing protein n=1 Tax=Neorhizobium galegae TaxID=399 RepID=UPI000622484A|nr:DUF982 domain-containing protein [Neorhizobium galegae]CDZ54695.1 Hypothetical protein NGAL_HAMBI2427_57600 [Neorhizobium galegae bv. orientalis]
MNIPEIPFRAPVHIRLPNGLDHTFHNVYDALDFLENEWPLKHGERYDRAVHRCRAALKRIAPVEIAREAFIAACLEAGMPMVVVAAGTSSSARAHPMAVSA